MGLFGSKKIKCSACGMEVINNECSYCGKSLAVAPAVTKYQPKFKRRESRIKEVHVHDDQHVISSSKPKAQTSQQNKQTKAYQHRKKKNTAGIFLLRILYLGVLVGWGFCYAFLLESFSTKTGRMPETGNEGGAIIAGLAFLLALFSSGGAIRAVFALVACTVTSLLLIIKPLVAPVYHSYRGQLEPFSYGSETHMYYSLSGVLLGVFTIIFLFSMLIKLFRWIFKRNTT